MLMQKMLLAMVCVGTVGVATATDTFYLDNFTAWRNVGGNLLIEDFDVGPGSFAPDYGWQGKIFFSDGFNDGVPPPAYGTAAVPNRYSTTGNFVGAEKNSLVEFSRERAFTDLPSPNGSITQSQHVQHNSAFWINDGFAVGAIFDLAVPNPTSRYGVRLNDSFGPETRDGYRDDFLDVRVRTTGSGSSFVEMFWQNNALQQNSIIGSEAFSPPANATEIWMMLLHPIAGSPSVSGYFRYFDAGRNMLEDWHYLGSKDLFHGEPVSLGQAYARYTLAPVPEPGTTGMLLAGIAMLAFVVRRR